MPQTSHHKKKNCHPKDCRVLTAKPKRGVWPPSRFLEEQTPIEVPLSSGLSREMQQF